MTQKSFSPYFHSCFLRAPKGSSFLVAYTTSAGGEQGRAIAMSKNKSHE